MSAEDLKAQLLKLGLVSKAQVAAAEAPPARRGASKPQGGAREAAPVAGALAAFVAEHAVPDLAGRKRFYFEARDGRVPYLAVADAAYQALGEGALCICESPDGRVAVLKRGDAARVKATDAAWVRAR